LEWYGVIDEENGREREDDCLTYAYATTGPAGNGLEAKAGKTPATQPPRPNSPKTLPQDSIGRGTTAFRSARQRCLEERQFAACNTSLAHAISSSCFEFPILMFSSHPELLSDLAPVPGRSCWLSQNDTLNAAYSIMWQSSLLKCTVGHVRARLGLQALPGVRQRKAAVDFPTSLTSDP
jgi:hypothetical protein